jgi:aryl-alcohol dehydrogenase-like predicted oxidoreductase
MTVETTTLAPGHAISRVLRGGWQLAGGHGPVERERAIADMAAFLDAGITTFDCADIYTGVEEMIGAFRARLRAERGEAAARSLKVHTKFVPDWDDLPTIGREGVRAIITRSIQRLNTDRLDLVQYHWWNYQVPRAVEVALMLAELQQEGLIAHLAGTNFDTPTTAALLDAGYGLVSMQVQYSLLDRRPEHGLVALAEARGFRLLCYGALAGGFLSERWLGAADPGFAPTNRSLVKYRLIIEEFGGWDAFQALLSVLARIAARHGATIPAIATRWVLDRPAVAGAIVGARYAEHLPATLATFRVALTPQDHADLAPLLSAHPGAPGDTYTLERDRDGPHGRIMKYNLNRD